MSFEPTFSWTCPHCGRFYSTEGHKTGFVKAGFFRHAFSCGERTPAERRKRAARDAAKWKRRRPESTIIDYPDDPGFKDQPPCIPTTSAPPQ